VRKKEGSVIRNLFFSFTILGISLGASSTRLRAAELPDALKEIGIAEHLGSLVSIKNLVFKDEAGKSVHLSDYFRSGRPVILNMTYFECPNLCTFVLNGLVSSLKEIEWSPSRQFEIITVSINPRETPELASNKKRSYLTSYDRAGAENGWHFLTGADDQIHKLADEVGFRYKYDPTEKQYAHSAALFVLTPEGKISRYLYGIEFTPKDMRLALLEATSGKIGNVVDRILLFCYRYDAKTKKYSVYLGKVMQAGGAGTILIFGGYLAVFWRSQRKRDAKELLTASEKKGV